MLISLSGGKQKSLANPYQHLFIWSILINKREMAKFFWKQGKVSIIFIFYMD